MPTCAGTHMSRDEPPTASIARRQPVADALYHYTLSFTGVKHSETLCFTLCKQAFGTYIESHCETKRVVIECDPFDELGIVLELEEIFRGDGRPYPPGEHSLLNCPCWE